MGVSVTPQEHRWGCLPSTPEEIEVAETLLGDRQGSPLFGDLAPQTKGLGAGKLSTPYKSVMRLFRGAFADEPQTGPDCTSHATRNAAEISRCVEIENGEPEAFRARLATEAIYGYRGHTGGGMSTHRATEFVCRYGLLLRQDYGFIDLSKYDFSIGERWGWDGPPEEVLDEAAEHNCRYYARITTVEEARDALAAGFGLHCGSQYGNDGTRNARGVARRSGSWNHDMAWGAADETGDDLYFLVLQSWGAWNRGGHPEWGPIPSGSFLIPSDDAEWMIRTGTCWAVGDVNGFEPRKLKDYGTGAWL